MILLIVYAITLLAGIIGFVVTKGSEINGRKAFLFTFLFGIVFSLFGFTGYSSSVVSSYIWFFVFQAIFLGLGYLSTYLVKINFWGEFPKAAKLWFPVMNAGLGMIGFSLVFNFSSHSMDGLGPYYALSIIPFVMPQFVVAAFKEYADIPQEIYKVWYFPVDAQELDFDKIDTNTIYMLELEYSKSVNDPRLTNTKLRAPIGMNFGDWFRSFIENYNYKFEQDPIHYLDENNDPNGWIFYVKPSFFRSAKYIDPELSITQNKLSEKNIIVARRVGLTYN